MFACARKLQLIADGLHNKIIKFMFVNIKLKFNIYCGKTVMGFRTALIYLRGGCKGNNGNNKKTIAITTAIPKTR